MTILFLKECIFKPQNWNIRKKEHHSSPRRWVKYVSEALLLPMQIHKKTSSPFRCYPVPERSKIAHCFCQRSRRHFLMWRNTVHHDICTRWAIGDTWKRCMCSHLALHRLRWLFSLPTLFLMMVTILAVNIFLSCLRNESSLWRSILAIYEIGFDRHRVKRC